MSVMKAQIEDVKELKSFLEKAAVSSDGVDNYVDYFIVSKTSDGEVIGTVGIEPIRDCGLLRSFVISPKVNEELIVKMFQKLVEIAKQQDLTELLIITNKQASLSFFSMIGFEQVERSALREELFLSEHGKHLVDLEDSFFMKMIL